MMESLSHFASATLVRCWLSMANLDATWAPCVGFRRWISSVLASRCLKSRSSFICRGVTELQVQLVSTLHSSLALLVLRQRHGLPREGQSWKLLRKGKLPPCPRQYSPKLATFIVCLMHPDSRRRFVHILLCSAVAVLAFFCTPFLGKLIDVDADSTGQPRT